MIPAPKQRILDASERKTGITRDEEEWVGQEVENRREFRESITKNY